ncbi:MAG TPA: PQQ-binding-like beta-propeller repeat protein [Gammaproteobacteria bacterium]|nr:PQQ-binding-like beta-propeller repeat protein [Gammaproteobacteria bacterium]
MKKHMCWAALAAGMGMTVCAWAAPSAARFGPGTELGWATFETRCTVCHGNPKVPKAPSAEAIRQMPPEKIYASLESGDMQEQAKGLTDILKQRVAEFMSGRNLGSTDAGGADRMPNQCSANPPFPGVTQGPAWNGWGANLSNTRFQPSAQAGLTAAEVPKLKLKWAFAYPVGLSSNAQPTIVGGRVFVGSDNGYFYSLDAKTGCVYWSYQQGSIVRGAAVVGPVTGLGSTRYAVYFGDGHANIFALDVQDGKLLWKTKVDSHVVARITAGLKLYESKVFVPVSSSEEFSSGNTGYPCCTSRGSVVALDAATGKQIWKTYDVPGEPKPYKTLPNGISLYKPAGGGIWSAPTIDPVRRAVYVGTGDATTEPSPKTTDAIMAVDIDTGKLLWSYQATAKDVFMGGCGGKSASPACPDPMGPDMDIGNSPILTALPDGRRVVTAGTKAGDVFGVDPDANGKLLYRVNIAGGEPGGTRRFGGGGIVWGGATSQRHIFYGDGGAGLMAIDPATGKQVWQFKPEPGQTLGAAPTVIPGVVFEGATNGTLYAVSATDGKVLWSFNTAQTFDAVNKIPAQGGSIASTGAVIAGGMVYIGSGYGISSGALGGNVLLAFGVE